MKHNTYYDVPIKSDVIYLLLFIQKSELCVPIDLQHYLQKISECDMLGTNAQSGTCSTEFTGTCTPEAVGANCFY